MRLRIRWRLIGVCALVFSLAATAAQQGAGNADAKNGKGEKSAFKPEASVTEHRITIDGERIDYQATAGTMIMKNDKGQPVARFGYTAYLKQGVDNKSQRPITFAYNGGPGSSSIWLHMGALGPRRVKTETADFTPPPPYDLVDNASSILDVTDLVMLDPVGTGYSRPLGKGKGEDFWGVDQDIKSVANFIERYVTDNGRWNSPKYLLGESYGTMRSAGVVRRLQSDENMAFNGVVLVSSFLDARTVVELAGNDLAHVLYLPTFAATAWKHDLIDDKPQDLKAFLDEVEAFAMNDYANALMQGARLSNDKRAEMIASLSDYTGLSEDYLDKADMRVGHQQFAKELMRDEHRTVGRLDSRFTGVNFNLLGESTQYDPMAAAIGPAFTAAFQQYYNQELQFAPEREYVVSGELFRKWDFKHQTPGMPFPISSLPNTAPDLARAMGQNPNLEVLVLNGYFDLATPYLATEYTVDHLDLEPGQREHIHMRYYQSGHMMYLSDASLQQFKRDVGGFIESTDRLD